MAAPSLSAADDGSTPGLSGQDVARINQLISNAASQLVRSPLAVQTENVALANGYHRIRGSDMKEGNPDWIYPNNVFVMLDGERVTVSRGDTLWNLSRNKLIESALVFDDVMARLDGAGNHELAVLITRAMAHATSEERADRLGRALETMQAGRGE